MTSTGVVAEPLIGKVLSNSLRLVQLLGRGGVGDVYLAERLDDARPPEPARVAVKVLRAEFRNNPTLVARFEREAAAASRVQHPHVLQVMALERDGGTPYFVMELLVGLDLADILAHHGVLSPSRAVRVAEEIARGLAAAHRAGVIHRDVKPENVFLVHASDGREFVKILDFGLSFIRGQDVIEPSVVVGTPEYMAPEQARAAPAEPTADVYALGVVLYEMLAGRVPFLGSYPSVARKHIHEPPPPLHHIRPGLLISPELDAAVHKALVKDPHARFASMDQFRRVILDTPEARQMP